MQKTIKTEKTCNCKRELYFRRISVACFIWNKISKIRNKEKIRLKHV